MPPAAMWLHRRDDLIEAVHAFLDTEAFERFGFPA
jgi:hypothetical protein